MYDVLYYYINIYNIWVKFKYLNSRSILLCYEIDTYIKLLITCKLCYAIKDAVHFSEKVRGCHCYTFYTPKISYDLKFLND